MASTTPDRRARTLADDGRIDDAGALSSSIRPDVRVLVVDDHAPFRLAARSLVDRTAGFTVAGEAVTGEEALAFARTSPVDLVLLDIKLPGIDGLATCRTLGREHPGLAVVLVSTYQPADLPEGALDAGAVAYLRKEDLSPEALRTAWARHRT